jgi:hypothetical protein
MEVSNVPEVTLVANKSPEEDLLCSFIRSLFCWSPQDYGGKWEVNIAEYQPCDERKYFIDIDNRMIVLNRRQISAELELCRSKNFGALFRSVLFVLDGLKPIVGEIVILNRLTNAVIVFTQQWVWQNMPPERISLTTSSPSRVFDGIYRKDITLSKKVSEQNILAFIHALNDIPSVKAKRNQKNITITGTDQESRYRQKMMAVIREFRGMLGKGNFTETKGGMSK